MLNCKTFKYDKILSQTLKLNKFSWPPNLSSARKEPTSDRIKCCFPGNMKRGPQSWVPLPKDKFATCKIFYLTTL